MKIPDKSETTRWYTAFSIEEADASWESLEDAQLYVKGLDPTNPECWRIKGIVESGPAGARFIYLTRFPVNEHDDWIDFGGEKSLLRSELVAMCRMQLATRDQWIREMPLLPELRQQLRKELMEERAVQYELAEAVIAAYGHLFPPSE